MNAYLLAARQPLPDYRHQPGLNPRPAEDFLAASLGDFPTPVSNSNWADNLAWCFGVRLINESFFWEAHEALEPVWMKTRPNTREQHLVQGAIQLANCALKSTMQKPQAATKLGVLAEECISRAYSGEDRGNLMGLDQQALMLAIAAASNGDSIYPLLLKPSGI